MHFSANGAIYRFQNVALRIAHLRRSSQILISLLDQKLFLHEYGGTFCENFQLFNVALIWLQIRNLRPRISGIGLFLTLFIHFWRLFITSQNFEEICKYVHRLTVCLKSARSAQRGLFTHLSCFRGTNIVLTAKRSYSRTLRRLQTILCDFWNLLQLFLRPKNA